MIILKATTKIPFVFNLDILFKKVSFESSIFFSFLGIKPKMPKIKKERYVKTSKINWKLSFSKYVRLLPNKMAIPWLKKVPIAIPK